MVQGETFKQTSTKVPDDLAHQGRRRMESLRGGDGSKGDGSEGCGDGGGGRGVAGGTAVVSSSPGGGGDAEHLLEKCSICLRSHTHRGERCQTTERLF